MADQFFMDQKGMDVLKKFFKVAPAAFQRVSAGTLNSMAFSDRLGTQNELRRTMKIRTPAMLKKGTRVQMASKSQPVDRQFSISGSVKTARHDAWQAIEQGATTRITTFSKAGRGGSFAKKAIKQAKAGQGQTTIEDFKIKGEGSTRIARYMQKILADKGRRRKAFYIAKRHKGLKRGMYKFTGGRVKKKVLRDARLTLLSTPRDSVTPRKINWKQQATSRAVTQPKLQDWWGRSMRHELGKVKRRL